MNGATGIIVAMGKGMLHSLPSPKTLNVDIIPVDFVVNSIIAAGWKTGLSRQSPKLTIGTPEVFVMLIQLCKIHVYSK